MLGIYRFLATTGSCDDCMQFGSMESGSYAVHVTIEVRRAIATEELVPSHSLPLSKSSKSLMLHDIDTMPIQINSMLNRRCSDHLHYLSVARISEADITIHVLKPGSECNAFVLPCTRDLRSDGTLSPSCPAFGNPNPHCQDTRNLPTPTFRVFR